SAEAGNEKTRQAAITGNIRCVVAVFIKKSPQRWNPKRHKLQDRDQGRAWIVSLSAKESHSRRSSEVVIPAKKGIQSLLRHVRTVFNPGPGSRFRRNDE